MLGTLDYFLIIYVSTERLQWRTMLRQMQESMLGQNITCARIQQYTNDSIVWLALMPLCGVT